MWCMELGGSAQGGALAAPADTLAARVVARVVARVIGRERWPGAPGFPSQNRFMTIFQVGCTHASKIAWHRPFGHAAQSPAASLRAALLVPLSILFSIPPNGCTAGARQPSRRGLQSQPGCGAGEPARALRARRGWLRAAAVAGRRAAGAQPWRREGRGMPWDAGAGCQGAAKWCQGAA